MINLIVTIVSLVVMYKVTMLKTIWLLFMNKQVHETKIIKKSWDYIYIYRERERERETERSPYIFLTYTSIHEWLCDVYKATQIYVLFYKSLKNKLLEVGEKE